MIKIENIDTCNWEAAIRGMRNPMNSWDKSDSKFMHLYLDEYGRLMCKDCQYGKICDRSCEEFHIGPNDLKLAKQLTIAGSDHGKFLRMIIFSCDITAPMYWWKEMDTYKVGTVRNSCSTMHKITSKKFELSDFSVDQLGESAIEGSLESTISYLNIARDMYLEKKSEGVESKAAWWQIIQLLPSSYNQRATWTANYEVLRNIYHARKNHKLDEWKEFCKMIEDLPYSELITEVRKDVL